MKFLKDAERWYFLKKIGFWIFDKILIFIKKIFYLKKTLKISLKKFMLKKLGKKMNFLKNAERWFFLKKIGFWIIDKILIFIKKKSLILKKNVFWKSAMMPKIHGGIQDIYLSPLKPGIYYNTRSPTYAIFAISKNTYFCPKIINFHVFLMN